MCEELRQTGRRVVSRQLDVRDHDAVDAAVRSVTADLGRVDILFNNAGVAFGAGPFLSLTQDQWAQSFNVNVMGIVNMCRSVLPVMIAQGGGSIINNSSIAGLCALPGLPAYSASKFAVIGLTQALAIEFGPHQIRVNAICPGSIHTRLGDLEYAFTSEMMGVDVDQAVGHIVGGIPLSRLGTGDDVADVVLFLASDASRYLTGTAIPITGGQELQ